MKDSSGSPAFRLISMVVFVTLLASFLAEKDI